MLTHIAALVAHRHIAMEEHLFVVLQDEADGGRTTMYPEVHYVYEDDEFSPETDANEQRVGDISVVVDLDESGQQLVSYQSLSPEWQITEASLHTQSLAAANKFSRLLSFKGTRARQDTDIPDLKGSFDAQVARGARLIEQLEQRNAEIRRAMGL